MPCSSVAASTAPTSRCSASAAASGPSRSISASVPSMRMKAMVTGRCSEVPPPPSRCARIAGDRQCASVSAEMRGRGTSGSFSISPAGSRVSSIARPLRLAQAARRQRRGGLRAHQDLACARLVFHGDNPAPGGAHRQQFDMRRADGEEVKGSGMHALRHAQRHLGAGDVDPAHVAQHARACGSRHGRRAWCGPRPGTRAAARRRRT